MGEIFSIFFRPGDIEASGERFRAKVVDDFGNKAVAQYKKDHQPLPKADDAQAAVKESRPETQTGPIIPGINNNIF